MGVRYHTKDFIAVPWWDEGTAEACVHNRDLQEHVSKTGPQTPGPAVSLPGAAMVSGTHGLAPPTWTIWSPDLRGLCTVWGKTQD